MKKKTYRVTGVQPVAGHRPGSTFEHGFSPVQEEQLVAGGAIAVVEPAKQGSAAKPKPTRKRQEA